MKNKTFFYEVTSYFKMQDDVHVPRWEFLQHEREFSATEFKMLCEDVMKSIPGEWDSFSLAHHLEAQGFVRIKTTGSFVFDEDTIDEGEDDDE